MGARANREGHKTPGQFNLDASECRRREFTALMLRKRYLTRVVWAILIAPNYGRPLSACRMNIFILVLN